MFMGTPIGTLTVSVKVKKSFTQITACYDTPSPTPTPMPFPVVAEPCANMIAIPCPPQGLVKGLT